jgi:putative heme-binding domain-containing protein
MGQLLDVDVQKLIEGLHHPAMSVRLVAQRRLSDRAELSLDKLRMLLGDGGASAAVRSHALWALDAIDGGESARDAISDLVRSGDIRLRRQAIRQLGTRRAEAACPLLISALRDKDTSIRFQASTALGRIGDPQAIPALIQSLDEPELFARYAVFTALNRIGRHRPSSWAKIVEGLGHENARVREGVKFAAREVWNMDLVQALMAWSANTNQDPSSRAMALEILATQLYQPPPWTGDWWAYHPALKSPPDKKIAWEGTTTIAEALRQRVTDEAAEVRLAAVAGFRQVADSMDTHMTRIMFRHILAKETDSAVREELFLALGELRDVNAVELVISTLSDMQTSEDVHVAAITAAQQIAGEQLGKALVQFIQAATADRPRANEAAARALGELKISQAVDPLNRLLQFDDQRVHLAVLEALSRIGNKDAIDLLSNLSNSDSDEIRAGAIAALGEVRSAEATASLLRALMNDEDRSLVVDALTRRPDEAALDPYLEGLASSNADLRHKCRQAIHSLRASLRPQVEKRLPQLSTEVISRLQDIYRDDLEAREGPLFDIQVASFDPAVYLEFARQHTGNSDHGREVFHNPAGLGCAKCHAVNGIGGRIGPDLSQIGEQFDRLQLAEHVLYPNKSIREGYRQTHIITDDGRQFSGVVGSETAEELLLRDTEGREYLLSKSEIETRNTGDQSLMPERIVESISAETFSDLLAYLEGLRRRGATSR